ncbi:uncharacterized protein Z519_09904 [Cladophialophora bantiana CBS 173.52]|uniref:Amino acid permease/ SLC12A domain-containing protein n=1 Tax=Cladophialophora bantiana (strain ATCC 10958 / CBS 173.52 / CDC B-1940 / NIH 8579) TaxID=1442370 RepID=A0A0D2FT58_CLAB1|nr:uncharacterized protein Z519_09904 [Cladophialophora bantiana CBS 173.52]KIW89747.1 hypothetical protein Z519_09904 [Cladophialophora bantiana CBS 173.52]
MASPIPHLRAGRTGDVVEMTARPRSAASKEDTDVIVGRADVDSESDGPRDEFKSTSADEINMRRMGRNQQLVRYFRVISMASFVAIATAAWEIGLFNISPGLTDGGRPALVYSVLWNFVGFGPIYLSMAEMASMAPIAGAQYHWVSEFAPESLQKVLSYYTGWTSTMAWQAGNALGVFLVGTLIQSIISINNPNYAFPKWHATLLVIGAVSIAFVGNVFGHKVLHLWQNAVFVIHVLAYFAFIIPIWVNAPRATTNEVWTGFTNEGGWSSTGFAVLVGQLSGIYTQLGLDTAAHMSEEVKDAAKSVPKAMISIYIINFCLIFPAVLTVAYHIPNIDDALADPTLYPTIYVLRQSMSTAWMTVILTIIIALLICSNITYLAAVTRDIWAFARDQGFPFSNWISKVDEKRHIPTNAIIVTSICSICLSLIYLGSPVAFYAITSLLSVALLQCYCLSIGCLLWRRICHPETLPPAKFSLGKYGIPINAAAVAFALWNFFWCFWPTYFPVTASNFNWASVLFGGTLIGATIHFIFVARKSYHGPVALVEGRNVHIN